jgi:hypothetical protein
MNREERLLLRLERQEQIVVEAKKARTETALSFVEYIEPAFPPSMKRKSDKWAGLRREAA